MTPERNMRVKKDPKVDLTTENFQRKEDFTSVHQILRIKTRFVNLGFRHMGHRTGQRDQRRT